MRVASWNMAYWTHRSHQNEAWRWMLDELKPDVLFVQEAVVPASIRDRFHVHWTRAYARQPWGTGIVSAHPLAPARVDRLDEWFRSIPTAVAGGKGHAGIFQADNWFACARATLPIVGNVLLGSIHSPAYPIEKQRLEGIDVTHMKVTKNPDLWFGDVLFHFLRPMLGSNLIVGGDFNASRLLDVTLGDSGNNEFFDRLSDTGFISLHRMFHDADQQTYFKKDKAPHQLDYLYADAGPARSCRGCFVQPPSDLSDHAAIIADFAAP